MAILTGFPPSNTVSIGTRFPKIVKKKVLANSLQIEDRFADRNGSRFFVIAWMFKKPTYLKPGNIQAICYRGNKKSGTSSGEIYVFDGAEEVTRLHEDWSWTMEDDPTPHRIAQKDPSLYNKRGQQACGSCFNCHETGCDPESCTDLR